MSYVRGMVMTIVGKHKVNNMAPKIMEIAPVQVKNITGSGRAAKESVKRMIADVLVVPSKVKSSSSGSSSSSI